jgi:hypothetical protein
MKNSSLMVRTAYKAEVFKMEFISFTLNLKCDSHMTNSCWNTSAYSHHDICVIMHICDKIYPLKTDLLNSDLMANNC